MTLLLRAVVSWLFACGWALLVALGALTLSFGNFVVAWQSFVVQGFEPLPLRHVPLLGAWAEGFGVGEAPLAALYALVLTLAMNVAIMATAKVLARTLRSYFDRRQALRSTDPGVQASAPDYLDQTVHLGVWLALLLIATVLIIGYDLAQFRLRYENLFAEMADPADALAWAPDAVARLGQFLAGFIRTATWGYLGCVIAMAVALEYALGRAAETWQALHHAVEQVTAFTAQASTQGIPDALPDARERPVALDDAGVDSAAFPEAVSWGHTPLPINTAVGTNPEPVSPPPAAEPPPAPAPRNGGPVVDVIIGPGRLQSFALAEVQADDERFVRDGSGRAWFLRAYWDELMSNNGHRGAVQ